MVLTKGAELAGLGWGIFHYFSLPTKFCNMFFMLCPRLSEPLIYSSCLNVSSWIVIISWHASRIKGTESELNGPFLFFFSFFFFITYFLQLHFQCYPKSPPPPLHTHSHFLALAFPCTGAYNVCLTNGPLFPVMAD
jgi:drug/metabolite transporter (DMT)-like permease